MGAWLQILQIVGNSTLFYPLFDTHDSPGPVFIWKSKFTIGFSFKMRSMNIPFPYEDGSRAVMGVKCYVKYCRIRPSFQNLQPCPYYRTATVAVLALFLQNGHFCTLKWPFYSVKNILNTIC